MENTGTNLFATLKEAKRQMEQEGALKPSSSAMMNPLGDIKALRAALEEVNEICKIDNSYELMEFDSRFEDIMGPFGEGLSNIKFKFTQNLIENAGAPMRRVINGM